MSPRSTLACVVLLLLSLTPSIARTASYELTTLADALDHPWCVAFLPEGGYLITERPGTLKALDTDGTLREIGGVPPVLFRGQGGLFDVLLDPDFAANGTLYLSYAHGDMSANATRVARARLAGSSLEDLEVLFTAEPFKALPQHYGGRLALLPDGTLLLTTGDGFDYREQAQNPNVTLGKTVRFNRDGSLPEDNPFTKGGGHPAVWTWGHRNPQGLTLDPATATVYLHEHGPKGGDEINVLTPGSNYGWPAVTYGDDYSGAKVSPFTSLPGMTQPLKVWVPSIAPSGFAVYRGDMFPAWEGSLLVGALVDKEVRRVSFDAAGGSEEEALFSELDARIRDVRVGPDGAVYVLTDGSPGKLLRVSASP
jgi:glucose/arabinose dehydrogenase